MSLPHTSNTLPPSLSPFLLHDEEFQWLLDIWSRLSPTISVLQWWQRRTIDLRNAPADKLTDLLGITQANTKEYGTILEVLPHRKELERRYRDIRKVLADTMDMLASSQVKSSFPATSSGEKVRSFLRTHTIDHLPSRDIVRYIHEMLWYLEEIIQAQSSQIGHTSVGMSLLAWHEGRESLTEVARVTEVVGTRVRDQLDLVEDPRVEPLTRSILLKKRTDAKKNPDLGLRFVDSLRVMMKKYLEHPLVSPSDRTLLTQAMNRVSSFPEPMLNRSYYNPEWTSAVTFENTLAPVIRLVITLFLRVRHGALENMAKGQDLFLMEKWTYRQGFAPLELEILQEIQRIRP